MYRTALKHFKRGTVAKSLPMALRVFWDAYNVVRYGPGGPRLNETIFIDPSLVLLAIVHPLELGKRKSDPDYLVEKLNFKASQRLVGRVAGNEIDSLRTVPLRALPKITSCIEHWVNGTPWEETGIYQFMLNKIAKVGHAVAGCQNLDDIVERYSRLDEIYFTAKKEGRLRSISEMRGDSFRETDGIEIHIGSRNQLVFGSSGTHRLAIALALGLPVIPAKIGFVHADSVALLPQYRMPPPPGTMRSRREHGNNL
jgi:hypothetical protein